MYRNLLVVLVVVACATASLGSPNKALDESPNFCQGCRSIVSFMTTFKTADLEDPNRSTYGQVFIDFCRLYYPNSTDYQDGPCIPFVNGLMQMIDHLDPVHHCDNIGACPVHGATPVSQMKEGIFCEVCVSTVNQFKNQVEDPDFVKQVHEQIDALCEYLASIGQKDRCENLLRKNIDAAFDFVKHIDAHEYCKGLCAPKVSNNDLSDRLPTLADFNDFGIETSVDIGKKRVKDVATVDEKPAPNCAFCKAFVREMFKFIKNNNTEENIKNVLDKGCSLIYHNDQKLKRCEELVNAYTKELVDIMADETDPEVVCTLLEQCVYTDTPYYKLVAPKVELLQKAESIDMGQFLELVDPNIKAESMKSCIQCKVFIKFLQENLADKSTVDEVKHWLKTRLCTSFDDQNTIDQCNSMVEQYGDIFFKAVVQELDPQQTCVELHACHPKTKYFVMDLLRPDAQQPLDQVKPPTKINKSQPICTQCQEIVKQIDQYVSTSDIDKDVDVLIDNVCNKIPNENMKTECIYMVKSFGLTLVDAIAKAQNPQEFCKEILLC